MTQPKLLAPILPYLAVWAGLFLFKNAWLALALFHLAIILVLFVARPNIPFGTLIQNKNPKWILLNMLIGGVSGPALYLLWNVFGVVPDLSSRLAALGLSGRVWIPFIAYFSFVNPFIEEYFWRGFLGSDAKGFYPGDLVYAGYHALVLAGKAPLEVVVFGVSCLTFVGWFWRQAAREDSGLLASVLGHMAADFAILFTVYRVCMS